jgi:hypothetical protein
MMLLSGTSNILKTVYETHTTPRHATAGAQTAENTLWKNLVGAQRSEHTAARFGNLTVSND